MMRNHRLLKHDKEMSHATCTASSVMIMSTFNEGKEVQPKHQGMGSLRSYDSCFLKPGKVGTYRTGFQSHIL